MRRTIMVAWLLAGVCGAAAPALAGQCDDGMRVTIKGKVTQVYLNRAKTISMKVAETAPCDVDALFLKVKQPPAHCKAGVAFTATGKLDSLFDVALWVKRLHCGD